MNILLSNGNMIYWKKRDWVYYESKREPKIRGMNKCRCDERLQTKTKEFTRLPYTGLVLELEHLKIETRLIIMMFARSSGSLLWIDKARAKDKRYKEVSVWWKTKTKTKEFTRLPYTGLVLELEHLKIETRLINERLRGLLWIEKARAKEKTYKWRSVRWETKS
jgi:hypothetical protein